MQSFASSAEALIRYFNLMPHPEGGYYRETYRSETSVAVPGNDAFPDGRSYSTAIYFLLNGTGFSAFHRIRSDELWHFYEGGPLHIFVLDEEGTLTVITLGKDIAAGQVYQAVVKAGCWFASRPVHADQYAFVGCTVSPGFDFRDFEMASRATLAATWPQHTALIRQLTREA